MSTFQPYLNKSLPESVQIVKTKEGDVFRVNILVGASETGTETLTYLVKHASSTQIPVYTAHLLSPRMLPSYVAASALYRMLAGLFLGTSPRPEAVILRTPNGELEDDVHAVTAWLKIQPDEKNSLLSKPITFTHFAQLWYPYANEVIPTIPSPFEEAETEVNGRSISHPLRPVKPVSTRQKVLYSRYMLAENKHLQIQYLDSALSSHAAGGLSKDSMSKWEQRLKEAHEARHTSPVAVQWIGNEAVSVALAEMRWSKEDELFEGIGVGNHDQIIDLLEIEDDQENTKKCLAALFHHVFVSEIRTDRATLVNSSQNASVGEIATDMGLIEQPGTGYTIQREDFWTQCPL